MKKVTFLLLSVMFLASCANEATESTEVTETQDSVEVIDNTIEFTTEDSLQIETEIAK
jgi:PBP1b-binding outer membrane lipoprotein LpoB